MRGSVTFHTEGLVRNVGLREAPYSGYDPFLTTEPNTQVVTPSSRGVL